MSETEYASFRAKATKIKQMFDQSALTGAGDPLHEHVYLNISEAGVVNIISGLPGNVTVSYCTFGEGEYLDNVEITDDLRDKVGDDEEDTVATCEALVKVKEFLDYLDLASDGGIIEVSFHGHENSRLATSLHMEGALNTELFLPASEKKLDEMPLGTVHRFDDDNRLVSGDSGESLPTDIETTVDQIDRIIRVVENDDNLKNYPITVEEGALRLDVGRDSDESRNAIWGDLQASEVEGPDFSNQYREGFKSTFKSLNGNVRISSAPGGAPACVVQDAYNGVVLRHILGPSGGS